jgi:hypothetical protein
MYVNGTITSRTKFTAVPKQNYNDVQICQNGGFEGNLSNLRYFSHALSAFEINNIVKGGPSLMAANNTGSMTNKTHTTYRTVGITQIDVDSKRRSLYVRRLS